MAIKVCFRIYFIFATRILYLFGDDVIGDVRINDLIFIEILTFLDFVGGIGFSHFLEVRVAQFIFVVDLLLCKIGSCYNIERIDSIQSIYRYLRLI